MQKKYGFTMMSPGEFAKWIKTQQVARTVRNVQEHHTFIPAYAHFRGNNHFELQRGMYHVHTAQNGWRDIGQHFSIFPDGKVLTGRSLELSPACIFGFNTQSICIENVGNFDTGGDVMRPEQRNAIVAVTAALCERFNVPPTAERVVYHHWFDLRTGFRTNGGGSTKSCPGTAFFGGNKVEHAEANFLPLVRAALAKPIDDSTLSILFHGYVTANILNIRDQPSTRGRILNRTSFGSILRVYEERNNWYRISHGRQEWVSGAYVKRVERGIVNTPALNVRSGPGTQYGVIGRLLLNEEVFVYDSSGIWLKVSLDEHWVSGRFVTMA
jgi:uncharacterized protein YgiM (DUF1202 family)